MSRIWRSGPGQLLAWYVVLEVLAVAAAAVAHPALPQRAQAPWLPLAAFLAWRVSRGGRLSRVILIIASMLSVAEAAVISSRSWSPVVLLLLAVFAGQIALLVSPAVHERTRQDPLAGWAAPTSAPYRVPTWMPLIALLAGLVVTLLYLGSMSFAAIPGCGPAGATLAQLPDRCIGLAQGYPVRFLTAYQGTPEIDKAALIEDWAQWSLVSFAAFYLLRLLHRRPEPPRSEVAAADELPAV
jgi:hypothetical protein